MDRFILIIVCLNMVAATVGNAQNRIMSLSLEEAVTLAARENFTLRNLNIRPRAPTKSLPD